ncbi:MAG: hypothetical protein RI990_1480 [Planctomycetota bacterium]|jgi:hypothetical protein
METASIDTILTVVAIVVNVVGFYFVIRQIRQQALATRGDTYTNLCGLSYDILRMMAERPHLYPYFYERKPLAEAGEHRVEVLCCCEMIANYCDNTALQRENIPDHVWQRWRNFVREQIALSVVLQDFMREYRAWYSPEVGEILDEVGAVVQPTP